MFMNIDDWQRMVDDCHLAERGSKNCAREHLSLLLYSVHAEPPGDAHEDDEFHDSKTINYRQFASLIVRVAIVKHVMSGHTPDVSDALHHLITQNILPRLPLEARMPSNQFRREYCYNEPVDTVLWEHRLSLEAIFEVYSGSDSATPTDGAISYDAWQAFLADFEMFTEAFTRREAGYTFMQSNMRPIETGRRRAWHKMCHMWFEDFLEAIVKMAHVKSLPTAADIDAAGFADAGGLLLSLRAAGKYEDFVRSNRSSWPSNTHLEAPQILVKHLLTLLERTVAAALNEGSSLPRDAPLVRITTDAVRKYCSERSSCGGIHLPRGRRDTTTV